MVCSRYCSPGKAPKVSIPKVKDSVIAAEHIATDVAKPHVKPCMHAPTAAVPEQDVEEPCTIAMKASTACSNPCFSHNIPAMHRGLIHCIPTQDLLVAHWPAAFTMCNTQPRHTCTSQHATLPALNTTTLLPSQASLLTLLFSPLHIPSPLPGLTRICQDHGQTVLGAVQHKVCGGPQQAMLYMHHRPATTATSSSAPCRRGWMHGLSCTL
jgi:hypothetical protein